MDRTFPGTSGSAAMAVVPSEMIVENVLDCDFLRFGIRRYSLRRRYQFTTGSEFRIKLHFVGDNSAKLFNVWTCHT